MELTGIEIEKKKLGRKIEINEANNIVKKKYINHIKENKDKKEFDVCFNLFEFKDIDIDFRWFRQVTTFILGKSEIRFYSHDYKEEEPMFKIRVIKAT